MKYKTRDMSPPNGKPNVLFISNPWDFEKYYSMISDDILERFDCAIWNCQDEIDTVEINQLIHDVNQMQLVVVPVTYRFLTESSVALDVLLPYVFDHFIPVLPILFDADLVNLFNIKFGNIQYLMKNVLKNDYNENLVRFLDSILVNSKLYDEVRSAFHAYIFLSYRKKDKKYAIELMKYIHQYSFCRNIAIWYDDFLIPGENFHKGIITAIEKSTLFAIVVTPNLINENNYVNEIEYPFAQDLGIPILPVEFVFTDRGALNKAYTNFPTCVNASDEHVLRRTLYHHFKKYELNKDTSPDKMFLTGIAYLSGIDVEINYEWAYSLIESAAKAECLRAMKKLSDMYYWGNGVTRDYEESIFWQKKYLQKIEEKYLELKNEQQFMMPEHTKNCDEPFYILGMELIKGYGILAEKKQKCMKDPRVEYMHIAEVAGAIYFHFYNSDFLKLQTIALLEKIRAYQELGHCDRDATNYIRAEKDYKYCLELLDRHIKRTGNLTDFIKVYFSLYNDLSSIYGKQGLISEAREYFNKALGIWEKQSVMNEEFKDFEIAAEMYFNYGSFCESIGDYSCASEKYLKAVEITKTQVQEAPLAIEYQSRLAKYYWKSGNTYVHQGNYDEAIMCFQRAYCIGEDLVNKLETVYTKSFLADIHDAYCCLYLYDKRGKQARSRVLEAITILEELFSINMPVYQLMKLPLFYSHLGHAYVIDKEYASARLSYGKVISFYGKLGLNIQKMKEAAWINNSKLLFIAYNNLAYIFFREGNLELAIMNIYHALDIVTQISKVELGQYIIQVKDIVPEITDSIIRINFLLYFSNQIKIVDTINKKWNI